MFDGFIGQEKLLRVLKAHLEASKIRNELPRHMLFTGPAGLGKTHVSKEVAKELDYNFISTTGRTLASYKQVQEIIEPIEDNTILFIDEIHGLDLRAAEGLYHVMEEGVFAEDMDYKDEDGVIPLVLIGATTDSGNITKPMRDRFSYIFQFTPYSVEELTAIASLIVSETISEQLALRSNGTARIVKRMAYQVLDFITTGVTDLDEIFDILGIDAWGLDENCRLVMRSLKSKTLGLNSISTITGLSPETILNEVEPLLMRKQLIIKTTRGRQLGVTEVVTYMKETGIII